MSAAAAARDHHADPRTLDRFLRRATDAFLWKDYEAARRIFDALLPPIAVADIDLGQDEMADEMLTVEVGQCAARYVVSTYMTADPERRPEAVHAAILEAAGVQRPIRGEARSAMLAAMRKAAEKRVEGVSGKQRRRYYDHAARLVAACATLDPTPEGGRWVAGLRARYSRYPALQRDLNERLRTPSRDRKR